MIRRRAIPLIASVAATLVLFGCGGGDDGDSSSQATAAGEDKAGDVQPKGAGKAVARGADAVAGICAQKQKQALNAKQRAELHAAIGSMVAAYRRDPDATIKKGATSGDALLNLAAGLVNHCNESAEAGRLLEAIRPKG